MQQPFKSRLIVPLAALIASLGISGAFAKNMDTSDAATAPDVSALFSKLDENGDGYVSLDEAAGKITSEVFSKADSDHDGKLSLAEFAAAKIGKG